MTTYDKNQSKRRLDYRFKNIAWALFLIMVGGLWLLPIKIVPSGSWAIGVEGRRVSQRR